MAHELDMSNNRVNFAHTGQKAWHGLGQQLDDNATLEEWVEQAGLNWRVLEDEVHFTVNGDNVVVPEKKVLYRSDTLKPLSIMSNNYKTVQPYEVTDFFRSLVKDLGYKISTAGSLKDGRNIWMLADLPNNLVLKGNDKVNGHLLLGTSYDGSFATTAMITTIRVVCNNTLTVALKGSNKGLVKISHKQTFNPNMIKYELGLIENTWDKFKKDMTILSEFKPTLEQKQEFFNHVLEIDPEKETSTRKNNIINQLNNLYYNGKGQDLDSAKETGWGLLNAVTEYVDHERNIRSTTDRTHNILMGNGQLLKQKAMNKIMSMV